MSQEQQETGASSQDSGQQPTPSKEEGTGVVVVGVGASAGGLKAFTGLLDNLEPDPGMALVYVQHRASGHQDRLGDLLAGHTGMAVRDITDGMAVEGGTLYLAPPESHVGVMNGSFHLMARVKEGPVYLPVDAFLRTLAEDRGREAVGVVLSGLGADGAQGLRAIHGAGGITLAQTEATAGYPNMPQSAIGLGVVDFVLSPAEIAEKLGQIRRHPYIARAPVVPEESEDLSKLLLLLRNHSGTDFTYYKPATIRRRVERRMALHQLERLEDYVTLLQRDAKELDALYKEVLVRVTSFFRDAEVFESLKDTAFPRMLPAADKSGTLRVWVPGCATGEEAYTIAMVLQEYLDHTTHRPRIQLFATDLDPDSVALAREGWYPASIAQDLTQERLERFFTPEESGYRVVPALRELCVFAVQNVVSDPPFSRLDLISCRNLLIYLGPVLKDRLLATFHYALKPDGFLLLGSSESVGEQSELYGVADKANRLYRKKSDVRTPSTSLGFGRTPAPAVFPRRERLQGYGRTLKEVVDRRILEEYAPPAVVVNRDHDALLFRGHTGSYLEQPGGEPTQRVTKMAREGLLMDLHAVIQEAFEQNRSAIRERVRVGQGEGQRLVDLEAEPLADPTADRTVVIVLFRERPEIPSPSSEEGKGMSAEAEERVRELEHELAATREYLQSTIEELEASNEELQSTNEELQSSNEELQSTSEELETSNEELKAANDSLREADQDKERRLAEVDRANTDLFNFLNTLEAPMAIFDEDLRFTRLSPSATETGVLNPGLEGQPLTILDRQFPGLHLEKLAGIVLDKGKPVDKEAQDGTGHWFEIRIHPYLSARKQISGGVLLLRDIHETKEADQRLQAARDFARAVVDTLPLPVLILDTGLRVEWANPGFYRAFGVDPEETLGELLHRLGNGQWDIPELRARLEDLARGGGQVERFRVEHDFEGLGCRAMEVTGRLLAEVPDEPPRLLAVIRDVTASPADGGDTAEPGSAPEASGPGPGGRALE